MADAVKGTTVSLVSDIAEDRANEGPHSFIPATKSIHLLVESALSIPKTALPGSQAGYALIQASSPVSFSAGAN
jgi:hypothetical protein